LQIEDLRLQIEVEPAIGAPWRASLFSTDIDRERLADLCGRHHARRLALFGSVLRPDFRPDSDVDVLVEFAPGHRTSELSGFPVCRTEGLCWLDW